MAQYQPGLLGRAWGRLRPDPIDAAIAAYVTADDADDAARAAAWAELKGSTCVDYVARAERHLASEDGETRRKAARLLATFVREAPPPPDACAALAAFCAARADDAPSAEHALRALAGVVVAARVGEGDGGTAAAAAAPYLFGDGAIKAPAFPRAARERVFDAQRAVLDGDAAELGAAASSDGAARFARGVAAAVDGERDPRCLLRALGTALGCGRAAVLIGWGDSSENESSEHYDGRSEAAAAAGLAAALAPYFPVSFVAPARNPHGVTAAGLREALRAALTAAPELAAAALDLARECLADAGASPDEVGEALALAARAAEVCPEASLEAKAEALTTAIAAVAAVAPAPAAAAARRLAARCSVAEGAWAAFARGLRAAVQAATTPPMARGARAAAQVLAAVASAGPRAWRAVVVAIAPALGAVVAGDGTDAALAARALAQLFGAARGLGPAAWADGAAASAVAAAATAATGNGSAAQAACRCVAAAAAAGAPLEVLGDDAVAACLAARCRDRPGLAAALAAARPAAAAAAIVGSADPAAVAALAAAPAAADAWAPRAIAALAAGGPGADAAAAAAAAASAAGRLHRCAADALVAHEAAAAALASRGALAAVVAAAAPEAAARAAPVAARQGDAAGFGACLARGGAAAVAAAGPPEGPCIEAFLLFAPRGDAATRDVLRGALAQPRVGDQTWAACARAAVARRDAPPGAVSIVTEAIAGAFSGNADAAAACVTQITAPAPRGALLARFWRQRLRACLAPAIVAAPPGAARDRALLALARAAPPAVIIEEATTLGAAAARALGGDGNQADAAALLLALVRGGASAEAAASGAVQACVAAAHDRRAPPACRADAVRCLGALVTELPHARFYPHRKAVGAALASVLDDERRCLRALAARSGEGF